MVHECPALVREGDSSCIVPARNLPGNLIEMDDGENMSVDEAFSAVAK